MMRKKAARKVVSIRSARKGKGNGSINELLLGNKVSSKTLGEAGESVAAYHLKTKNYRVIGRNIRFKRGEVDILALKDNIIRIIEVKTGLIRVGPRADVIHETFDDASGAFGPENNFTKLKISRLKAIAAEIVSKYPFPLLHLLDYDARPGHEALVINDGGGIEVKIEGFAVRIFADDSAVKTIKVRHFEDLVS